MAKLSQIRWKQGDYIRLGKAVADFNKKINRLQAQDRRLYLPDNINYYEQKGKIYTRRELNRIIASLRRFTKQGAEDLFIDEAGRQTTKWQYNEMIKQSRIAVRNLDAQLTALGKPIENGFSRLQMGSVEAREIEQIRKNITNYMNYEKEARKRAELRISQVGSYDYPIYKALIYRKNYMDTLRDYQSNYEGYQILLRKLNSIQNPITFYEYIKKSNVLADLFVRYSEGGGIVYGAFASDEEAFNYGLEEIGLIDEEREKILKYLDKKHAREELVFIAEGIRTAEELFSFYNMLGINSYQDLSRIEV